MIIKLVGEVGKWGTASVTYDVDVSDDIGSFTITVPQFFEQNLRFQTTPTNTGYSFNIKVADVDIKVNFQSECLFFFILIAILTDWE